MDHQVGDLWADGTQHQKSAAQSTEGIGVQAINLKLPFDSPEFGCIFSTISSLSLFTFHFSTHSGEEPIFGSLPL